MIQMVITDLDGTLLNPDQKVSQSDYGCLKKLGQRGIVRVIATGRSPYSFSKVISKDFPVDYLVFSSGAGIMRWSTQEVLTTSTLPQEKVKELVAIFRNEKVSFKLLNPIPNNHTYYYFQHGDLHSDFKKRMTLYTGFETKMEFDPPNFKDASQFLIILSELDQFVQLSALCKGVKVIRATSPLDHLSIWMEIFHQDVSKGNACRFLCQHLGIDIEKTIGIGNDYNDIDLLQFVDQSFVVDNAPSDLKKVYQVVSSNKQDGFSEAVKKAGIPV